MFRGETLRSETEAGVCEIVLSRPEAYNPLTPAFRDELAAAIDAADDDREARVILLRAEGPAFCAGYGLDWSTEAQAEEGRRSQERVWDSVADLRMMGRFVETYMKLWYARKPTLAAVQGWCIGGGTDILLDAPLRDDGRVVRVFGYPVDELHGDLELLNGKLPQILEGGVAGAEVVESDGNAASARFDERLANGIAALHE